jgi:hypothetical protein
MCAALVAVTFGCWLYLYRTAQAARAELDNAKDLFGISRISGDDFLKTSRSWCLAACAIPFADQQAVCEEHQSNAHRYLYLAVEGMGSTAEEFHSARAYAIEADKWVVLGRPRL